MARRPTIAITVDTGEQPRREVVFPAHVLKQAYSDAVLDAGGEPILAVPGSDPTNLLSIAEGFVISGGAFDLHPELSGADPDGRIDTPQPERTAFEYAVLDQADAHGRPVLGICGGMQLIVARAGGSLWGDLRSARPTFGEHEQPTSPAEAFHGLRLEAWLARELGRDRTAVNSTHHQGVRALPPSLRPLAWADDGLVEAVDDHGELVVGVQWHPELLNDDLSRVLYEHLIRRAGTET